MPDAAGKAKPPGYANRRAMQVAPRAQECAYKDAVETPSSTVQSLVFGPLNNHLTNAPPLIPGMRSTLATIPRGGPPIKRFTLASSLLQDPIWELCKMLPPPRDPFFFHVQAGSSLCSIFFRIASASPDPYSGRTSAEVAWDNSLARMMHLATSSKPFNFVSQVHQPMQWDDRLKRVQAHQSLVVRAMQQPG